MLCGVDVSDVKSHDDMVALAQATPRLRSGLGAGEGWTLRRTVPHRTRAPDILVGAGEVFIFDAARVDTRTTTAPAARCPPPSRRTGPRSQRARRGARREVVRAGRAHECRGLETGLGTRADRPPRMGRMSDEPKAPLTTTTSIWPAAGVLLFAVAMLLVFILINFASDQGVTKVKTTVPVVVGGLNIAKSSSALEYCEHQSGDPDQHQRRLPRTGGHAEHRGRQYPQRRRRRLRLLPTVDLAHEQRLALGVLLVRARSARLERLLPGRERRLAPDAVSKGRQRRVLLGGGCDGDQERAQPDHWTFRIYQNSETI